MTSNPLSQEFNTRSLLKFAFPNIVMMTFLSLYTIVDGMFVSSLVNTTALGATNIVYPIMALELGVGIMLSTGSCALISKKMGEGHLEEAKSLFSFIAYFSIALGALFTIFGTIFLEDIVWFLHASELQFPYAMDYLGALFYFTPAFFLQLYFQYLFTADGRPDLGLISTIASGVANIILDYIFIKYFHMGIKGAGIATGIGYSATAIMGLIYFSKQKEGLRFTRCSFDWQSLKQICFNGSSEMVGNLANAITTYLFNLAMLQYYGDDGVAAITIVFYFQFVFVSIFFGYSAGVCPIISYKYGEKNHAQLKKIISISLRFILIASLLMYGLSNITIKQTLRFFCDPSTEVFAITLHGFKRFSLSFLCIGFPVLGSALFTSLNNGRISAIIAFLRTFVFIVCNIFVLPLLFGADGLWLTIPLAEFSSFLIAFYYFSKYKEYYQYR